MERISKVGKGVENTLEEILTENNLKKDDIMYVTSKIKKGLFKSESVEISVYKKSDIFNEIKNFLKEIINNLGIEVTFEILNSDNRTTIKMHSDNNGVLIGHNGNMLKSLENIAKQKIINDIGIYINFSLDVENYKDKKVHHLERLAKQTAKDVLKTKTQAKMENMNSYERRIVHNVLTNFKGVTTKSEGEEPNRHVVISYTKE